MECDDLGDPDEGVMYELPSRICQQDLYSIQGSLICETDFLLGKEIEEY